MRAIVSPPLAAASRASRAACGESPPAFGGRCIPHRPPRCYGGFRHRLLALADPAREEAPHTMLERFRRRQTLASFDHQWGCLREGDAMLSDPWFRENVENILVEELLCVEREWFRGRTVL